MSSTPPFIYMYMYIGDVQQAGCSNLDGGTLVQLINGRNVATNILDNLTNLLTSLSWWTSHAVAMHYFGMNSLSDVPSQNPSQAISKSNKWSVLKHRAACIIDRYVVVDQLEKFQLQAIPLMPIHMLHVFNLNIPMWPHSILIYFGFKLNMII